MLNKEYLEKELETHRKLHTQALQEFERSKAVVLKIEGVIEFLIKNINEVE